MALLKLMIVAYTGRYAPKGNTHDADAVLGFGFGGVDQQNPGASNEDLAAFAYRSFKGKLKVLQSEIADAYAVLAPDETVYRITEHRQKGKYLDSREVAEQAKIILSKLGAERVAILAHPNHVGRANTVCERLGLSTVVPPGLECVRFDPGSCQKWTRNRGAWIRREVLSIIYYRLKGWV
jgi:hypothetical protein